MPPLFQSCDDEKLRFYYPDYLQLKLVQVIHRHGERTPATRSLEHVIPPIWNLCHAAKEFRESILSLHGGEEKFSYRRTIDPPGACVIGQLTDIGRRSMSELGAHFRTLYVDKLKFLDKEVSNNKSLYLRSTDFARTFESLQQLVTGGLYPSKYRSDSFVLDINTRELHNETLHPNFKCARLMRLTKMFKEDSKSRYESELKHLTSQLKSIVNEVKIDSKPSCNVIFDTVVAAKANGIPIPKEFTDEIIDKLDKVTTGEWFNGSHELLEMRKLSMGPFLADLRDTILSKVNNKSETRDLKFAIYSGHDATIVPLLTTFSEFDHRWPKFNSHITLELFESNENPYFPIPFYSYFSPQYYIRVKYNDKILELPACQNDDQHHPKDKSLCTLKAFLTLVDSHIPKDYDQECLDK